MNREYFEKLDIIIKFKEYIISKNYSSFTLISYINDLYYFYKYINKNLISATEEDIRKYIIYLNKSKKSSNTISRTISTFKTFYKFLLQNNLIKENPVRRISFPKKAKRLPKFLYYNEMLEIINETKNNSYSVRDRLIIEMLYATGVRISELINIKLTDIDFNERKIVVMGKGSKERVVYYGEHASLALKEYLNVFNRKDNKYLFLNARGEKLTTSGVRYIINNIMKRLSIKTHVTPHVLRHTFATDMLNNGCDIIIVQELLGHSSLSSTEVYTHVTNERIKEVYYDCFKRRE